MALTSSEKRGASGFIVNATNGHLVVTHNQAGATMQGGLLRDADGRLVVRSA